MSNDARIGSVDDDKLLALVEVLFLAATADGEFGAEERAEFAKSVESLCEGKMPAARLAETIAKLEADVAKDGRDARFAGLRSRLPDEPLKRAAVDLAIRLFQADGIFRTSEREALLDLADALEFDRDKAADMVKAAVG